VCVCVCVCERERERERERESLIGRLQAEGALLLGPCQPLRITPGC
jgi:hypothetical protein